MKKALLFLLLTGVFTVQTTSASADGLHDRSHSSAEELAQAEYLSAPLECTVVEVATQYESGDHKAAFHCIDNLEASGSSHGMVYELEGLPPEFEHTYRDKLESIKERLKAVLPPSYSNSGNYQGSNTRAITRKAKSLIRAKLRASNIYRSRDRIILTEDTLWSMTEDTQSIDATIAEAANSGEIAMAISATDQSTVLVLHITALDSQTSASPSELSDSVFGTYGDAVNLASQYNACSYGKKTFVPAQGSDVVDGVAQINIGINATGESSTTVMNAATSAANDLLGNLSGQFDHVMYAIPPGTDGGWIAFGYFNYYPTVYNDNWATKVSAQMHEVGHNLYLQHSNEGGASYADQQGMMGYSYNQDDGPVMCFNAAKSSQLTWYSDKEITINHSWSGKVVGLADYDQASAEQSVILKVEGNSGSPLYITYNRQAGINSGTREAGNQVTIVRGADRQESDLLAKLGSNGTHTIGNFWGPGNDFTITVDEIGTDFNNVQYALISIEDEDETPVYNLVVNNGGGDGSYTAGEVANISASAAPSGEVFDRWVVNSGGAVIANPDAASTTLTMPASATTITATYKDQPLEAYTLTVNSGSGDGTYEAGAVANLSANSAPSGQVFDQWVVESGGAVITNITGASTTLIMPSTAATVTATYRNLPPAIHALTVNNGSGDGSYLTGAAADITANSAAPGQIFDQWVVNSGGAVIDNANAASASLIMPSNAVTVTATYKNVPPESYELSVNNGSGDGDYTEGAIVNIQANAPLPGQEFDRWEVNSGDAVIANTRAASTTLTMGSNATTVTPQFKALVDSQAKAEQGIITGISSTSWTTVNLNKSYSSMVVVATPNYSDTSKPAVARIRKASGSRFQVRMSVADVGSVEDITVHYLVVEEGVYNSPKMEARKIESDGTNGKGSWERSSMEEYNYAQTYTKPVVLGQVMTHRDPRFSVFWASKGRRKGPPSASACYVGKHIAGDTATPRNSERLGVIVIEAGSGILDGIPYTVGVGSRSVGGVGNSLPYSYSFDGIPNPETAILSTAGMKSRDGGWPILYGSNPVTANAINLAVDEDSIGDSERKHGAEKLAYIVFGRE